MKNLVQMLVPTIFLLATGLGFETNAQNVDFRHKMTVKNTYKDKYVWITSMERGRTVGSKGPQINYGCIDPGQERTWTDARYQSGNYFIRAEVMSARECKGAKVCDTTALSQVDPKKVLPVFVYRNATDANNCFIGWK